MIEEKIYSDDPLLRYKETKIKATRTKAQIDGILAEYEIKDVWWHWEKDAIEKRVPSTIYVMFTIEEVINRLPVKVGARIDCPVIWDRTKPLGRPPRPEMVNWDVSMRAMHWLIYTHLNSNYAMRSSKVVAFFPYIRTGRNELLKDRLIPELVKYTSLASPQERSALEG